jgi:hypothetical protein
MMLLSALLPDCRWLGGAASISVRARGPLGAPLVEGSASLSRGSLATPFTKQPLTGISGMVKVGACWGLGAACWQAPAAVAPPPCPALPRQPAAAPGTAGGGGAGDRAAA